jgi:anti-anti-sigma regulatory factor
VICDVAPVTGPDRVTVEALARLRVAAGRHGRRLVVSGAGPQVFQVVGLFGLSEVLVQAGG